MKLNEDTVKKLEEAFSIGADVSAACYYANISRQTYYNWVKENKEMAENFDRLKERPVLKAYQTVAKTLGDSYGNAMDYLKRKRKKEFGDNLDVTSDNKPIPLLGGNSNVINSNQSDKKTSEAEQEDTGSIGWDGSE